MSSSSEFFDMINNPIQIPRGYKTIISVKPTAIDTDDEVKAIDIDKRKCLFKDEFLFKFNFLKEYSASGCKFECMYKFRFVFPPLTCKVSKRVI